MENGDINMLVIKNLYAAVEEKEILKGINLHVKAGEIHAIMGPNGSGKSTLANILSGRPGYEVISGEVIYKGQNLLDLAPEARASEGIFLAFQYPVEIPGVPNLYFLRMALNAQRKYRGEEEIPAEDFLRMVSEKMQTVHLKESLHKRSVNEGFSGGEKKRNEIFHMMMLEPSLALLDETDSGLDIDALRVVSEGVNSMRSPDFSAILVTHYQRLLDHIVPDHIHVLADGKIVRSGDRTLALELEREGYGWVDTETGAGL
jgi:Fe-S cluster assembly ATP-binding protein